MVWLRAVSYFFRGYVAKCIYQGIAFVSSARVLERWSRVETPFSLSSPCLRDMVLQVLQDTQSKKEYFRSKESYLETFLPFVLSIFFFPSPSEGHRTPSILCIYSYKKENIPEQGKKFFFPLKMKIRVYISNEPCSVYSLNKIFEKIIIRIVPLIRSIRSLMMKEIIIIKVEQFESL